MEVYRKIRSPHDDLELDVLEILPDGEALGVVQIVHGMQEHKERYRPFMEYLARHGYAVVASDHRGHGKSVRNKKDFGYFYDESGEAIVEDLEAVSSGLRIRHPHVPFFMIAHSMGTLIARKYLKTHDEELAGLILSGPVYENPKASAGKKLVDVVSRYRGSHYISKHIANMVEGSFDHGVEGTLKNRWLSRNEDNVRSFNEDPLCGQPFTLNGYRNLMILIEDAYSTDGWKVKNPQMPILFAAGDEDPVIGSPKEFALMQKFLRERGYENVSGRLYPQMRHEILNELCREQVYEDFYRFLRRHTPEKGSRQITETLRRKDCSQSGSQDRTDRNKEER